MAISGRGLSVYKLPVGPSDQVFNSDQVLSPFLLACRNGFRFLGRVPAGTEGSTRAKCRNRKSGTVIRTAKNAGRVPIGIAAAKFVFFWRRIYIFVPRVRRVQPDDTSVRIVGYLTAFDCLPSLAPWSNGHKVQASKSMPQGLYDR